MKSLFHAFHFKEIKYGVIIPVFALIPVALVIIIFQIILNMDLVLKEVDLIRVSQAYNVKMLLYYMIGGVVHILICSVVISHFVISTRQNTISTKLKVLVFIRFLMIIMMFSTVYLLDAGHIKLASMSHERLYILMEKADYFKPVFIFFPKAIGGYWEWFRIFSIFPFLLICFALLVMICAAFYIGKELYETLSNTPEIYKIKEYISDTNLKLKGYVQLLSVVLVSSTISTILFFNIPVSLIDDVAARQNYKEVSMAMGVCWGITFSLTLLFLCIVPYILVHKKISSIIKSERIRQNKELEDWISENKSYYSLLWNLRIVTTIASPALVSIFTSLLSNSFG